MKRAPHPPYSPDITPSDFYLLGNIKEKLKGYSFESPEELRHQVHLILNDISKDELNRAFLNWKERLQRVIETKGEYIH